MDPREKIYDTDIQPLVCKLVELCTKNGIPMLAVFQYSKTGLATSIVEPLSDTNIIFDENDYMNSESSMIIRNLLKKYKDDRR